MESGWDELRVLGAVTAVYLLLWAACGVGYTVYVYLLPQARRGAPWLRRTEPGQVRGEGSARQVGVGAVGTRAGDR